MSYVSITLFQTKGCGTEIFMTASLSHQFPLSHNSVVCWRCNTEAFHFTQLCTSVFIYVEMQNYIMKCILCDAASETLKEELEFETKFP